LEETIKYWKFEKNVRYGTSIKHAFVDDIALSPLMLRNDDNDEATGWKVESDSVRGIGKGCLYVLQSL
jgi:hypothetical protein